MHSGTYPVLRRDREATRGFAQRLGWARVGVAVLQTLLLLAMRETGAAPATLLLLTGGIAAAAASSLLALLHLRRVAALDDRAMLRHVLADLAVLSYLLAISGGPDNPFHDAYFLPVAVAAATMAPRYAWRVALASMLCYSVVQFFYVPLPGTPEVLEPTLIAGEWITHAAMTALATYFLSLITHNLRQRERQLSEARESAARAECAVAVGSIAAGAAHELSTPMTTIATVLAQLRARHTDDPELRKSLDLIDAGVGECRKALAVLRQAKGPWSPPGHSMPVGDFVAEIVARLQAMRPTAVVRTRTQGPQPEPVIVADLALQQAVMNLLVNAVQVSPFDVALDAAWSDDEIVFRVTDAGPGIPAEIADRLGMSFVTTKPGGTGMGLFLTRVTAQRLGGRFNIRNAPERGAIAEILLPLALLTPRRT